MDYEHDVFISYKRSPIQNEWIREHFMLLFLENVRDEIAAECHRPARSIFFDEAQLSAAALTYELKGIEPGQIWRDELKAALKTSRCLVALWTPSYFYSPWCKVEFNTFRNRGQKQGKALVVGVSVHDGKAFPAEAKAIQFMDLSEYKIIGAGFTTTPMYVDFQRKVMDLAHYVAKAVSEAPDFEDWPVADVPA
ncbi:MAG TPA: toll/interleukin-1 receptor domain-containing protein, partial [Verrucomicrobiae bacterium]|nr:toll/interleukin-1 receptor domain-containing protein [Verrucomicrobiae bacterium]